jgi:hypothetical protein
MPLVTEEVGNQGGTAMGIGLAVIVGAATTVAGFSSEVASGVGPNDQIAIEFERTSARAPRRASRTQSARVRPGISRKAGGPSAKARRRKGFQRRRRKPIAQQPQRISPRQMLPLLADEQAQPAEADGAQTPRNERSFGAQPRRGEAEDNDGRSSSERFRPPERAGGWHYILHPR